MRASGYREASQRTAPAASAETPKFPVPNSAPRIEIRSVRLSGITHRAPLPELAPLIGFRLESALDEGAM